MRPGPPTHGGELPISSNDLRINERIRIPRCRLIGVDGSQLGIFAMEDAQRIADDQGFDLVEIAPSADPPVCRVMDYGKFKYEQSKKEKEQRKKHHIISIKEVRMTPKIDDNDFRVKVNAAEKFLKEGDKVKATVRFRGREIVHTDLGRKLMVELAAELKDVCIVEREPRSEGKNMIMILSPKQD